MKCKIRQFLEVLLHELPQFDLLHLNLEIFIQQLLRLQLIIHLKFVDLFAHSDLLMLICYEYGIFGLAHDLV